MAAVLFPVGNGPTIVMDKAVVLIGRSPDCDAVITGSRKVSRRHCCLVQVDEKYYIRDLGSMNGMWVNGKRVEQEQEITPGDEVAVGDVKFRFQLRTGQRSEASPPPPATPRRAVAPEDISQERPVMIDDEVEVVDDVVEVFDDDVVEVVEVVDDDVVEVFDDELEVIDDVVEVIEDDPDAYDDEVEVFDDLIELADDDVVEVMDDDDSVEIVDELDDEVVLIDDDTLKVSDEDLLSFGEELVVEVRDVPKKSSPPRIKVDPPSADPPPEQSIGLMPVIDLEGEDFDDDEFEDAILIDE